MKNKSILIYVKNAEALTNYIRMIKNGEYDNKLPYSMEVRKMIEEFYTNEWNVYLGTIENFDTENEIFEKLYYINKDEILDMNIKEINKKISIMIIRNLGSVELNFESIKKCLKYLTENYEGKVINNSKAMLKGMTKNYLTEIDSKELKEFGIITIPTKIYPKDISFLEICKDYPKDREKYLIKPLTGELSNSLKCLKEIDEEFLRYKESKVGGWVVQPIQEDIWKGEYQLSFLDGELVYAQKKEYPVHKKDIPSQKNRIITKYKPGKEEIENIKKLIEYFSKLYQLEINICRVDFMKDNEGRPKLLEFEMVNPGFFIGYMDENDKDIKNITESIRKYCEKILDEN
ncbi:MAG: hypothetical protein IJB90_01090 [Clostridia bacterium]|nr:hypothetical protein [Clostridia bacterium]